jgi:hypothetical protein
MEKSRGHRLAEPNSVSVEVFDDELQGAVGLGFGLRDDSGAPRLEFVEKSPGIPDIDVDPDLEGAVPRVLGEVEGDAIPTHRDEERKSGL